MSRWSWVEAPKIYFLSQAVDSKTQVEEHSPEEGLADSLTFQDNSWDQNWI